MTCQKISYATKQEAQEDIRIIDTSIRYFKKYKGKKAGRKKRAYECPICGNWHITTQKQKQKRKW